MFTYISALSTSCEMERDNDMEERMDDQTIVVDERTYVIMNCGLCALLMAVLRQSYKYEMYFLVSIKNIIIPTSHEMRIQEQSKRLKFKTHRETYRVKGKENIKSRTQRHLRSSM